MSKKTIEIILNAVDKGVKKAFTAMPGYVERGMNAVKTFNKTANNGVRIMGGLESAIGGIAGAYLGLQGISSISSIIEKTSTAAFTLESSLKAASRQFADTGSMADWEASIDRLSEKLKIYSNNDLQIAAAKTVDMTKRLGFSNEQMEEMIRLTGDLSAGRTDLEGGIERVTAAMRGEAEASEYLGLTLNENYVKSWYEASGAMQGAWKDLDDMQKAQVRYQVFLEQALPVQGKAAESTQTFAGALQLVRTRIEDAISGSETVTGAMSKLATVLNENSEGISTLVANMVSWAAWVVEVAVKHQDMLVTIGKVIGAVYLFVKAASGVGVVINTVKGLSGAFAELTGMSIGKWATSVIGRMRAVRLSTLTLKTAFGSLFAIFAAWEIGKIIGSWLGQFSIFKKAGLVMVHTLTMAWLGLKRVWAAMPWVDGSVAKQVNAEIDAAKAAYKEQMVEINSGSKQPGKKTPAKQTGSSQEPPAITPVQQTVEQQVVIAPGDGTGKEAKKEIPEYANAENDPDNVFGYRSADEVEKEKKPSLEERYGLTEKGMAEGMARAVNAKLDAALNNAGSGSVGEMGAIKAAMQELAGKHEVKSVEVRDQQPKADKVHEIRIGDKSMRATGDVDDILRELEMAGATA